MTNRIGRRLTAAALVLSVCASAAVRAQTRDVVPSDVPSNGDHPIVLVPQRDPAPPLDLARGKPRAIGEWKIDDMSRLEWNARESSAKRPPKRQAKKKSHKGVAIMLIAIGGAVAGGFFGSTVQGSLCECDDQGAIGAAYGGLLGGAAAGLIAYAAFR